tara:strand:+ start:913 stop:1044 length:132 start_codon:yes stop_codon:yes gene_type:complete
MSGEQLLKVISRALGIPHVKLNHLAFLDHRANGKDPMVPVHPH